MNLKDGKRVEGVAIVDVSNLGYFDELEYEVWSLFQEYAEYFGLTLEDEDAPDWATVKEIQETILKQFADAGVLFDFDGKKKKLLNEICDIDLSAEDKEYIMNHLWDEVKDFTWAHVKVTLEPMEKLPAADFLKMCGIFFYAKLPSKRGLMFYDFTSNKDVRFSNPACESTCEKMEIPVADGHLIVEQLTDPDYPGFAVSYEAKNGVVVDLTHVEVPIEDGTVSIYTYADPWTEDFTRKDVVSFSEIQRAIDSLE